MYNDWPTVFRLLQEPDPIANFQCAKKSSFEQQNITKEFNCKGQTGQKNARTRLVCLKIMDLYRRVDP